MDIHVRCAMTRSLELPELIYQVASYLHEPGDLYAASCCSRLWYETLIPLRVHFPYVLVSHASSFSEFLKSDQRAVHHCQALRILCDDSDKSDDDSDTEEIEAPLDSPKAISDILDLLAESGALKFFMYALPGESEMDLTDDVWITLRKLSNTLQGLYIELAGRHWSTFLASQYSNLQHLRLFLDSEFTVSVHTEFNPKDALLTFLHQHQRLQILHLYLGPCFSGTDFSELHFPELRSFLLNSTADSVAIRTFIANHQTLRSLDVFAISDLAPFAAHELPNLLALRVSALTFPRFRNVLAAAATRAQPIRHLQVTVEQELDYVYIQQHIAPLGRHLRCLDLLFWRGGVSLLSVLENTNRMFPELAELSLFVPTWGIEPDAKDVVPFELEHILRCFASSKYLLAVTISDPIAELLEASEIEQLAEIMPPRLRYIVWCAQTFRIDRKENRIEAVHTFHPRNFRGSQYLRDWHEEMVFDHIKVDYDE